MLGPHNIRQKVDVCSEPGRTKGGNEGVSFPPLPAHSDDSLGSSGPNHR